MADKPAGAEWRDAVVDYGGQGPALPRKCWRCGAARSTPAHDTICARCSAAVRAQLAEEGK